MEKASTSRDVWISATAVLVASMISGAVVLAGHWSSEAAKEKEISLAYVQMSVDILSRPPEKSQENLRKWAVDIVQNYAPVRLNERTAAELTTEQSLPPSTVIKQVQNDTGSPRLSSGAQVSTKWASAAREGGGATVPSEVQRMWVFYQSRTEQNVNGCKRPPNADPISPQSFVNRIDEFRSYRARNSDIDVIITAESPKGWDHAAQSISIGETSPTQRLSYWCNGTENTGYLLP